ncbi:hypothetical protein BBR47_56020 [Brevibacillus brevis NBRC 100599]|uniref:DUF5590 domain-containing protein n=1 Tax=Brevibacillus brevis (strain 47 / JCM 6285 / NBRC 100599) TaxID=358681 RepID=C0Z8F2_BREBN|nr:hypothetical protein [Brevibacillus brevis]BAH46579.1 hypothetical protein BBR47_56020 [Brevibacillus brevis NBRC 100599]
MKKRNAFILGLVLAGAVFTGSNLYTSEDIEQYEKGNHLVALHSLGIKVNSDELAPMQAVIDENGKEWIYNKFSKRAPLMDKIIDERSVDVKDAFIEVQDEIMQEYTKKGDTLPVILLDENLNEGYFAFNRQDGETLSFKIKYDNGAWEYALEK